MFNKHCIFFPVYICHYKIVGIYLFIYYSCWLVEAEQLPPWKLAGVFYLSICSRIEHKQNYKSLLIYSSKSANKEMLGTGFLTHTHKKKKSRILQINKWMKQSKRDRMLSPPVFQSLYSPEANSSCYSFAFSYLWGWKGKDRTKGDRLCYRAEKKYIYIYMLSMTYDSPSVMCAHVCVCVRKCPDISCISLSVVASLIFRWQVLRASHSKAIFLLWKSMLVQ